jgi:hypothetical protein
MNFTVRYIFIVKALFFFAGKLHNLYRFYPLSWIIPAKDKKVLDGFTKDTFRQKLKDTLGNFQELPVKEAGITQQQEIITEANLVLEHQFEVLGSGRVKSDPIQWHTDFKSGFSWPKGTFYKDYQLVDLTNTADVKMPWELSRAHHLLVLGEAYLVSADEKYAREIVFQIENWIDENPFLYSVNWTCAMDVSIRAINWMYAVNMILKSESVADTFIAKMMGSIYLHGWYVFHNLEKGFPYSANHYASNVVGLVFMGRLLSDTSNGRTWYTFGRDEYYKEVREQVLPSGMHFERSTSYHRLMTELFAYTYFLLKRVNEQLPFDIEYRIKMMFEFVRYSMKPNGHIPLLGDNDDGRLLPFMKSSLSDHRYLLCIDSIAFKNASAKAASQYFSIDAFFILGPDAFTKYTNQLADTSALQSFSFADAGIHVIRNEAFYLCINNSGVSRYGNPQKRIVSSHTHADLLSYELSIGNTSFIVDPGTFVYTASAKDRNHFRSTAKHNTVCVDGYDQYTLPENDLFSIADNVQQFDEGISVDGNLIGYKGGYQTQKKNGNDYTHHRSLSYHTSEKQCTILDEISVPDKHKVESYTHFDAGVIVNTATGNSIVAEKNGVAITMVFESECSLNIDIIDDTVSPSYGKIAASTTVKVWAIGSGNVIIKTTILSI